MKIKSWVVWLLAVVFLASEVFLFSANQQKNAALVRVREAGQQMESLHAQVAQLKNDSASSQTAEVSRLRAENQDLPRLRNEVTRLQSANQKLNQQLQATHEVAQQQQQQLQQLAAENQQAQAVAQASDAEAERNACLNNLRQIDAAKQQWALEKGKTADYIPTEQDVAEIAAYLRGGMPICPSGGTYTINAIGVPPSCSISGHVLP